jgi:transposase
MDTTRSCITHTINDIPLLIGLLRALKLDRLLDDILPTHGNTLLNNELTNGEALCIWLVYLLSQGDHRKWLVEDWIAAYEPVLSRLWGHRVPASDFTDDRLTTLLGYLALARYQAAIDRELFGLTIAIYELTASHVRLDATAFTGYHQAQNEGIMQYGHVKGMKEGVTQCKLMAAATATGQYLTGQFHPGQCADDPLYRPLLDRLYTWDLPPGLLLVGDSKMGALATRQSIAAHQHYYYMPLADSAISATEWTTWVGQAVAGSLEAFEEFAPIWRGEQLLGYGYALSRVRTRDDVTWSERVQVIRSLGLVAAGRKILEKRLGKARKDLAKLTQPPRQRVKSYPDEAPLRLAITAILHKHDVEGLLVVGVAREETWCTKTAPQGCYRITTVQLEEEAYREALHWYGWRVYVTNAPRERLSLAAGFRMYRKGAGQGIERMNKLLKDHDTLGLDRLYVHNPTQIVGLAYFITLALRVMTYIESTIRQSLAVQQEALPDYAPGGKVSATPTAKTMLERVCFRQVTWTETLDGGKRTRYVSVLPAILVQMLRHLNLSTDLYLQLLE